MIWVFLFSNDNTKLFWHNMSQWTEFVPRQLWRWDSKSDQFVNTFLHAAHSQRSARGLLRIDSLGAAIDFGSLLDGSHRFRTALPMATQILVHVICGIELTVCKMANLSWNNKNNEQIIKPSGQSYRHEETLTHQRLKVYFDFFVYRWRSDDGMFVTHILRRSFQDLRLRQGCRGYYLPTKNENTATPCFLHFVGAEIVYFSCDVLIDVLTSE